MEIEVPAHAAQRIKERIGLKKKAVQRQGELAWERGIKHGQLKGQLRKWVDREALGHRPKANYYIIFNNHLFFFRKGEPANEKVVVLSMIKVPQRLLSNINNLIK